MNHERFLNDGEETMAFMNGWFVKYGIFTLTMLLFCLTPMAGSGAPRQNAYLILLDPAHGGEDPGVVSDKLREKDLTMNMALLVRQEAQKMPGLQVQLTRSADRRMTIAERVKAAGTMKADCLVSLHVNAGFGKKATGYEIYFPGFRQAASEGGDSSPILKDMARNKSLNNSVRLAQQIQSGLETVFPRKGRGLRDAPSPLLDGLTIPGLVVEIGFATHPDDRKKLTEPETQRAVARALVKGLQDYFQKAPAL
jgi:N-acetylmuramoyl-L-alanine amidase